MSHQFLLQDSLGGHAKTLMFVNLSAAASNAEETLCSLQFASRVRQVELGAAVKSTAKVSATIEESKEEGGEEDELASPQRGNMASPPPRKPTITPASAGSGTSAKRAPSNLGATGKLPSVSRTTSMAKSNTPASGNKLSVSRQTSMAGKK